ncbi:MAG: Rad52/Rad22 family DNA repair protein [Pyrinomonadaceae bacterium]
MNLEYSTENDPIVGAKEIEAINNVLDFPSKLKVLRNGLKPDLVRQRKGWSDKNGNTRMVDYVEWHTVADILDETTPDWAHEIKAIDQIGSIVTVIAAITIDGVTRQGIGTGFAESETGIKKAEHDALKRAAVKFGIARELYKNETDESENENVVSARNEFSFPHDPIAKSLSDLVTAKQLGLIRVISKERGMDANAESRRYMNCTVDELSRRAASCLISHLQQNPMIQDFGRQSAA